MKKRAIKKVSLRKRREQAIHDAAFLEGMLFAASRAASMFVAVAEAMKPLRRAAGDILRRHHDTLMEAGFPHTRPVLKRGGLNADLAIIDEAGPEIVVPRGSGICGCGCGCFNQCELRNPKASTLPYPARIVTVLDGHKVPIQEALRRNAEFGRTLLGQ